MRCETLVKINLSPRVGEKGFKMLVFSLEIMVLSSETKGLLLKDVEFNLPADILPTRINRVPFPIELQFSS
jgi:hypothetical protein